MSLESFTPHTENKEHVSSNSYDAIVVLPTYPFPQHPVESGWTNTSGIVERLAGYPHTHHFSGLGIDTRLKDLAAVFMVKNGDSDTIITLSRQIRTWMEEPYTELMEKDIRHQMDILGISSENIKIIKEDLKKPNGGSYDLKSEIDVVSAMINEFGWKNIGLISDQEHGKRVQRIVNKLGQSDIFTTIPMETILLDPEYLSDNRVERLSPLINSLHSSPFWTFWTYRELFARNAMGLVNYLSKITR